MTESAGYDALRIPQVRHLMTLGPRPRGWRRVGIYARAFLEVPFVVLGLVIRGLGNGDTSVLEDYWHHYWARLRKGPYAEIEHSHA